MTEPNADSVPNDNDLFDTFNAKVWAERFVLRVSENPTIATDVGTMLAWFAGAIMTGWDHHGRSTDLERTMAEPNAEYVGRMMGRLIAAVRELLDELADGDGQSVDAAIEEVRNALAQIDRSGADNDQNADYVSVESVWETCEGCGREYRYPHLCRTHHLCGLCHPPIESAQNDSSGADNG